MACCWILIGGIEEDGWLFGVEEDLFRNVYTQAFYFCTTTLTTVGYGDASASSVTEKYYIIFIEFAGIAVFAIV